MWIWGPPKNSGPNPMSFQFLTGGRLTQILHLPSPNLKPLATPMYPKIRRYTPPEYGTMTDCPWCIVYLQLMRCPLSLTSNIWPSQYAAVLTDRSAIGVCQQNNGRVGPLQRSAGPPLWLAERSWWSSGQRVTYAEDQECGQAGSRAVCPPARQDSKTMSREVSRTCPSFTLKSSHVFFFYIFLSM